MYELYTKKWVGHGLPSKLLLIMKLTTFILLTVILQVSANTFAQKITLSEKNTPLVQVLERISEQSGYDFMFSTTTLKDARNVTIKVNNAEMTEVLKQIFNTQPLSFEINAGAVVVSKKEPSFLDNLVAGLTAIDVKGRVLDAKGEPLEGATIVIKGTNRAAKTNAKGEFMIANVPDDAVLVIRYVGYKTLEIPLKGTALPLEIRLNVEMGELEEVKVMYSTGYQDLPKERATGSFELIDNEQLNRRVGSDILSRLEGVTTSVFFDRRLTSPNQTRSVLNNVNIRGLSTLTDALKSPLVVVDNFPYEGDINNINPNDVENISILKDAAAASIWGARAANGVIVITTKKGKFNQPVKISLNTNVNIIEKPDLFHFPVMSSSDFIDVEGLLFDKGFYNTVINNVQRPALSPATEILLQRRLKLISAADSANQIDALRSQDVRHDFEKYIYQTAINKQYALNLSGGSEKVSYNLSAGFDDSPSILKRDLYKRTTLNSDNSYNPIKSLTLRIGVRYTNSVNENNSTGNIGAPIYNFRSTQKMPLYTRFVDESGNRLNYAKDYRDIFTDTAGGGRLLNWKYRILDELENNYTKVKLQEFIFNTGFNLKITNYLNLLTNYQYLYRNLNNIYNFNLDLYSTRNTINQFTNLNTTVGNLRNPVPIGSILDDSKHTAYAHQGRAQLNFNHAFDKHQLNGLAGFEVRESIRASTAMRIYGYDEDKLSSVPVDFVTRYPRFGNLSAASISAGPSPFSKTTDHFVSLFANAAYIFSNRYTLSGSARRDAANQFGIKANNQWKPFWSAGISWNLTNESFFDLKWISNLRIRTNYGYQGNVNNTLSPYTILSFVSASSSPTSIAYSEISSPANPDLNWETIKQFNVAVDFGLLENRISGSFDFYKKSSDNLIFDAPIDQTTGIVRVKKNSASLIGKGMELSLNTLNLSGAFKWNSELRLSYNTNKVIDYVTTGLAPLTVASFVGVDGSSIVGRKGISPYALFSYPSAGLDPQTGEPRGYLGSVVSKNYAAIANQRADTAKMVYHGSAIPTLLGSVNNSFSYKGVSLLVSISYEFNYYFKKNSIHYANMYSTGLTHPDFSKRWKQPGDEQHTTVPSLIYPAVSQLDGFYKNSEVNILKGDNIRLESIRLGYDLDKLKFRSLPVRQIRLFVSVNNLGLLWTANKEGLDPRYDLGNSIYPVPKTVAMGLNFIF